MAMKRPRDALDAECSPQKRRLVAQEQRRPQHTEPAPQIPSFAGGQLLRSITAALRLAGFDSVNPSALEMLRAQTEEYMLRFAREVRISMTGQRRARPAAQDFACALSHMPNSRAARALEGQLALQLPSAVSCPVIAEPAPTIEAAPDLTSLLQPLIETTPRTWVPKHFPQLPASHTWRSTDVWPVRETDARKMREKATQEGMLAEQALRKLATAAKAAALESEARRRQSHPLQTVGKSRATRPNNDDLLGEILSGADGVQSQPAALDAADGLMIDAAAAHWRGGKRQGVAF